MSLFLIVGLGNPGLKYHKTRHNLGFEVVNECVEIEGLQWSEKKYGMIASTTKEEHKIYFLKPNTFMNLSGTAVKHWRKKYSVDVENLLIIADDVALPTGKMRMKKGGSSGGHNGLKDIEIKMGTKDFPRLKIGIGADFSPGGQSRYVLGKWTKEEQEIIQNLLPKTKEVIDHFVTEGIDRTMNKYN